MNGLVVIQINETFSFSLVIALDPADPTSIEDPVVIEKILAHLDAKAPEPEATRRPPCRAPPQRGLFDETG